MSSLDLPSKVFLEFVIRDSVSFIPGNIMHYFFDVVFSEIESQFIRNYF